MKRKRVGKEVRKKIIYGREEKEGNFEDRKKGRGKKMKERNDEGNESGK